MEKRGSNYVKVLWSITTLCVLLIVGSGGMTIWWALDTRPVLKWYKSSVSPHDSLSPGEEFDLIMDVEKLRACTGTWQVWLDGPTYRQALNFPAFAKLEVGQRSKFAQRLTLPKWLPDSTYKLRVTSLFECNPLRQRTEEDMPPIPLPIVVSNESALEGEKSSGEGASTEIKVETSD